MKAPIVMVAVAAVAAGLAPVATVRALGQAPAKLEPLDAPVRAAIEEALRDERRGEAFYGLVLKNHGEARPFSNVVHAERRHASYLVDLLSARGLAAPETARAVEAPPAPASIRLACAAAVELERQNVAIYDRLLAGGPLPLDVRRVFEHNRMASLEHHEPAFERCAGAAVTPAAGAGHGQARRGCGHAF